MVVDELSWLMKGKNDDKYIFTSSRRRLDYDKPIDVRTIHKRFKVILKNCFLRCRNFGVVRETFAVRWTMLNGDMRSLSELIIIDDGSKDNTYDNTYEVINMIVDDRIKYYKYEKNQGANYARNYGIKKSTGEFVAFLDSDNVWSDIYLKSRIEKIKCADKNVGAIFGCVKIIKENLPKFKYL